MFEFLQKPAGVGDVFDQQTVLSVDRAETDG